MSKSKTHHRGHGEGTYYQRPDGLWCGQIRLGMDGRGKRVRITRYGATKMDVLAKIAAAKREWRPCSIPTVATVESFLLHWLETTARPSIRPSTYKSYEVTVRLKIAPKLGAIRLDKLAPLHIQGLYADLALAGDKVNTIRKVHATLHRALHQAVKWEMIARNPADLVQRPRIPHLERPILSPQDVRSLLDAAKGTRLEALFVLAVATGLRQGELLGLKWEDLDRKNRLLKIRRTLTRENSEYHLDEPKTAKGRRAVAISSGVLEALERRRQIADEEGHGSELIFPNWDGKPLDGDAVTKYLFKPLLKRAGLPDMRFHDLRHTAATLLLSAGVHPKIVQERLGHSSIGITLDTYSHAVPSMQHAAADLVDEMVLPKVLPKAVKT